MRREDRRGAELHLEGGGICGWLGLLAQSAVSSLVLGLAVGHELGQRNIKANKLQ